MRLALSAAAALSLLVAACGGIENEPNFAKAVERTEATGSSRFEFAGLDVRAEDDFTCRGVVDYARSRLRIACRYAATGTTWRCSRSTMSST